jgi:hypothetical protein
LHRVNRGVSLPAKHTQINHSAREHRKTILRKRKERKKSGKLHI